MFIGSVGRRPRPLSIPAAAKRSSVSSSGSPGSVDFTSTGTQDPLSIGGTWTNNTQGTGGNVAAGTVTQAAGQLFDSAILCTNPEPMAGGRDRETDAHLRARAHRALRAQLAALAAAEVAGREAELTERQGVEVPVLVARAAIAPGKKVQARDVALAQVPERYAPPAALASPQEVVGMKAVIPIAAGSPIEQGEATPSGTGARSTPLRRGERVVELVALGSPELIAAGGRVDLLVTREKSSVSGQTTVALEDVEVLAATPAEPESNGSSTGSAGQRSVSASLRVTAKQAVYIAAAQSFAKELRLLPRAPNDRRHGLQGSSVSADGI